MEQNPGRRRTDEEEYQLSETEVSPEVYARPTGPVSLADKIKRKNILMLLGMIIILFAGYKIIDIIFFTTTPKKAQVAKPTQAQPAETILEEKQPVISTPVVMENRLIALERSGADNSARLEKVEANMAAVNTTLSEVAMKLANLNNTLQLLSNEITQQQAQLNAFETTRQKSQPKKIVEKKAIVPKAIYHLQAAVPGRAWLRHENGSVVTVSVGSQLPGYGIIINIDPVQGIVKTSLGREIAYSREDR